MLFLPELYWKYLVVASNILPRKSGERVLDEVFGRSTWYLWYNWEFDKTSTQPPTTGVMSQWNWNKWQGWMMLENIMTTDNIMLNSVWTMKTSCSKHYIFPLETSYSDKVSRHELKLTTFAWTEFEVDQFLMLEISMVSAKHS
jgi:hypothetical protein